MVEVLGTGINLEALLGDIGTTISTYANNVVSTLISAVTTMIGWLKQFLQWVWAVIVDFAKKFANFLYSLITRYVNLLSTDPFKFSLYTLNLAIIVNNSYRAFFGGAKHYVQAPPSGVVTLRKTNNSPPVIEADEVVKNAGNT